MTQNYKLWVNEAHEFKSKELMPQIMATATFYGLGVVVHTLSEISSSDLLRGLRELNKAFIPYLIFSENTQDLEINSYNNEGDVIRRIKKSPAFTSPPLILIRYISAEALSNAALSQLNTLITLDA